MSRAWSRAAPVTCPNLEVLFRGDAFPGDLTVFFDLAGPPGWRDQDHVLAFEPHPPHPVAADPAWIRGGVNAGDKLLAVIGVVATIGAVFPADARRQFLPSIAHDRHHAPVGGEGNAAQSPTTVGCRACCSGRIPGGCVKQFPRTNDRWHPVISREWAA